MEKIKRVSYFFKVSFLALFVIIPTIEIVGWLTSFSSLVIPLNYRALAPQVLSMHTKIEAIFVSFLPVTIELFTLYFLIQLFKLYEKGEIFSARNVSYIRKIAYALLAYQLAQPFYQFMLGVVLTWQNGPGHRVAQVTFGSTNIGVILLALLVLLVSWIMAEGCKLREEQQLTI